MFITSGVSQYKILSYINEQSENSCPGKPNQEKNKSKYIILRTVEGIE